MTSQPSGDGGVDRTLRLDPAPPSAGEARRAVVDALLDCSRGDLADTAGLLVSELVTNAIVHAGTQIRLRIRATSHGIRVEVTDSSPHLPVQREYGAVATTGRGVTVVQVLAERYGADVVPGNGKTVWFELGTSAAPSSVDEPPGEVGTRPAMSTVRLLHVPVALARAWQQHADALLREHLLASFDWETDSIEHLDRQAGAGEAFNALADALAGVVDADDPPEHADIELRLTTTQAAGFRSLDFLLDRAAAMAEAGELLAPPTQPEIRRLRRWMSDQVMRQAEGREAVPWLGLGTDDPLAQVRPVEWDPTPVVTAKDAVIAADDSNRILAASPAALELLGWGAADLVGRRIVAVIPRRLREAHIAAFTLHLLAGRTSILDRAVQVPAMRRDGTEVAVDLLVRRQSAGGRAVFVATMTPTGGDPTG